MKTGWAVVLTVVIMAALAGGGYYYLNKQNTADKATLQSQIDDLNTKLVAEKKASTAATTADATANWKIYTDKTLGFTLKYPSSFAISESGSGKGTSGQNYLSISVDKISSLDGPLGNTAEYATARKAALANGQVPSKYPLSQPYEPSEKVVSISNGKYNSLDEMILAVLECSSVDLARETVFYSGDYQISITSWIAGDNKQLVPAEYLTTSAQCESSSVKVWGDRAAFYTAISTNKLTGSLQDWHNDYAKIIGTITFSN